MLVPFFKCLFLSSLKYQKIDLNCSILSLGMWLAIKSVPQHDACAHCKSRNIIVDPHSDEPLYGEFCSADCQKTVCGKIQRKIPALLLPEKNADYAILCSAH